MRDPIFRRRHFNVAGAALALWGLAGPAASQTSAAPKSVLIVGDSLSAEYGLRRGSGWVALLEQKLIELKSPWRVVNASISGDTTSGGRSRLPALLRQHRPALVVIELGGNDALRGLPLEMTEQNLRSMAQAARTAGARVLIVGMQVPPNYGAAYTQRFAQIFAQVAQAEKAALVPFLLKGVADAQDPLALFQADRIHPNEQAQPTLLANVWPVLQPLLK